jgi:predicted outer membrane repeat protein
MNTPRDRSVLYLCKQRLDTPGARLLLGMALALGVTLALVWGLAGARLSAARAAPPDNVIHVDRDATGTGTGLSWTDAYTRLQDALDAAGPGDEIWVAEGVYTPTAGVTRTATFQLKSGVALYGGFAAAEVTRTQRNWDLHVTVLSGDLDGNDVTDAQGVVTATANITGSNAYHVVVGSGVTGTAVLDGFSITAGNAYGFFDDDGGGMFNDGGSPTLANVTFSGNSAYDGGGMYNRGDSCPTLTNVTFSDNSAGFLGGGMYNNVSTPTLTNVTFSGNYTDFPGGGMYNWSSNPVLTDVTFSGNSAGYGGGMYNRESSPTLTRVTFSSNSADAGGGMDNESSSPVLITVTFDGNSAGNQGGGMRNHYNSNPTLTSVTFNGNSAEHGGGGMYNRESSPTLTSVAFSSNSADNDGGGMYNWSSSPVLTNVTFSDNSSGFGGGLSNWDGNPVLTNVTFSGNTADTDGGGMHNSYNSSPKLMNVTFSGNSVDDDGGGMYNSYNSSPKLMNVTFSSNSAEYGGGMHSSGNPELTNVTFSSNSAEYGGGMYNEGGSPTLTGVTFSGNTASVSGGGMYNWTSSNPMLANVTFSGNSADEGGGVYKDSSSPTVRNTLFVRGAAGDNCAGDAFAAGSTHNLADDGSCGSSTTQSSAINPGALGDYGGDTQTVPLLPGSSAIDAGDPTYCPATDQRGAGRVGVCDIGAFEAQGFTLIMLGGSGQITTVTHPFPQSLRVGVTSDAAPPDPVDGGMVIFTAPASGAGTTPAVYTATIGSGSAVVSATANTIAGGPYTVTAGTAGAAAGVDFTLTNTPGLMSTTTALDLAPNPSLFGQSVVFTATVTSIGGAPTGNVAFYDDGGLLGTGTLDGSGVAIYTTAVLAAGTHPITATYGGDASFETSTSEVLSQVVRPPVYLPLVLRGSN